MWYYRNYNLHHDFMVHSKAWAYKNLDSADYSNYENGAQKIDCYVGCVASRAVLLKPNVDHIILFNFWKRKLVEQGTATLATGCHGNSLLTFEKNSPMMPPFQNPHQTVTRCGCIDFSMIENEWLMSWNTKSELPFMVLKPKQSKMYSKIGLIEWGTVRPAVVGI